MGPTFRKLLKIEAEANNNKWYEMHVVKSDTEHFIAKWGRVGNEGLQKTYPIYDFEKKYNEKIRKGYEDVTEMVAEIQTGQNQIISKDKEIEKLVLKLQKYASINNDKTYLYSESVTKYQLEHAQLLIDNLIVSVNKYYNKGWNANNFNNELISLYKLIPRKMNKVSEHLISQNNSKKEILDLIINEQNNLDALSSSYNATKKATTNEIDNSVDLIESLGLTISTELTRKEEKEVKEMMGRNVQRISKIYKIENKHTQQKFDDNLKHSKNKLTRLLFHGSRNQSWWYILQQGLKIRPSNAVYSGSMYGDGIYSASSAEKSLGYTSLLGSKWAHGNDNVGYLALFEFHVGKQKIIHQWDSKCNSLCMKKLNEEGYDSTFAKAGQSLKMDEFIIYKQEQATIKYLIEIK